MVSWISPEPPSVPVGGRRPVLGLVVVSALVMLAFGARYAGESQGRWLDHSTRSVLDDWTPLPRSLARLVIGVGDPMSVAVLVAVLAGLCLLLGRRRLAVLAVLGPTMTGVLTTLLKPMIGRTLKGDLAYPSGHLGGATSLALVAGLLLVSVLGVAGWAAVAVVAGLTAVVGGGMAVAVTVVNYHYPTDAVGGFCTAVSVVLGLALLLERWPAEKFRSRRNRRRRSSD
jgi:membrane-associated phospholipid phosphatase